MNQKAHQAEVIVQEKSIIDEVIQNPVKKKRRSAPKAIPPGFERLPAGVERELRVNKKWINGWSEYPFIIRSVKRDEEQYFSEAIIEGESRMAAQEVASGCSLKVSACVSTKASILVKR